MITLVKVLRKNSLDNSRFKKKSAQKVRILRIFRHQNSKSTEKFFVLNRKNATSSVFLLRFPCQFRYLCKKFINYHQHRLHGKCGSLY